MLMLMPACLPQSADDEPQLDKEPAGKGTEEEAAEVTVPYSRLVRINKPEWLYFLAGSFASAAVGCVQPAFALIIAEMIATFYNTPLDEIMDRSR